MDHSDVVIVGGGIAGLCCARRLCELSVSCRILEASDGVGGRVRSDELDGFILDRGFQVLLTAYPEAQSSLDYDALELQNFEPGALVRYRGRFRRMADPWRRPQHLLATAFSPVATLKDKLKIASLRRRVCSGGLSDLLQHDERTTLAALSEFGFSEQVIRSFFKPFLGGVFLESDLATSSRLFEFVFRMFSVGEAALPLRGMGAIPRQLAAHLPEGVVQLCSPVRLVEQRRVELETGELISSKAVVIATEESVATKLLGHKTQAVGRRVTCIYFAAERPPLAEPNLVLNGDGSGPINNLSIPSQVSPDYAPPGQALISTTVLGDPNLDDDQLVGSVRSQLVEWFGNEAAAWRHLRTYRIHNALPNQKPPSLTPVHKPADLGEGLFVCGDYCDLGSLNGAMASGRRAADAVLQYLSSRSN